MISVNLNDELSQAVEQLAKHQHKPIEQIINTAIVVMLEDYQDTLTAELVLNRIDNGEEKIIPWSEVKAELYDLNNLTGRKSS